MEIYTFPKNKIRKLAIKQVLSIMPLIVIIMIGSFSIVNHLENNEIVEDPVLFLIMVGIGLFILIGGFFTSIKTISKILYDTKYIFNNDSVKKQIPNGKNIEIFFRNIRSINSSKKGILIKTQNDQLLISSALQNFKELEVILKSKTQIGIQHFDTKFKMNEIVLKYVVGISIILVLVSFFLVDDKKSKLIVGIPLVVGLFLAIYYEFKKQSTSYIHKSSLAKLAIFSIVLLAYLIYIAIAN